MWNLLQMNCAHFKLQRMAAKVTTEHKVISSRVHEVHGDSRTKTYLAFDLHPWSACRKGTPPALGTCDEQHQRDLQKMNI